MYYTADMTASEEPVAKKVFYGIIASMLDFNLLWSTDDEIVHHERTDTFHYVK